MRAQLGPMRRGYGGIQYGSRLTTTHDISRGPLSRGSTADKKGNLRLEVRETCGRALCQSRWLVSLFFLPLGVTTFSQIHQDRWPLVNQVAITTGSPTIAWMDHHPQTSLTFPEGSAFVSGHRFGSPVLRHTSDELRVP
jgi:hypothetical protein